MGHNQPGFIHGLLGCIWQQSGVIIVEGKRAGVLRISVAACAHIPGAEVTIRIVGRLRLWREFFYVAEPWSFGSMWRYDDPFARERIEAAMRSLIQY